MIYVIAFATRLVINIDIFSFIKKDKKMFCNINETIIKNGIPVRFKQGPGGKFFNGKENERYEGVLHTLAKWMTDEERLDFLRKFGWLIHDAAVNAYSAKFKPKK